jgi:aspartate/methionine/tyrosine aminotransferase
LRVVNRGNAVLPARGGTHTTSRAQRLATRERVLLLPGSVFGAGATHFRLGLGRRDYPEALKALERVLAE